MTAYERCSMGYGWEMYQESAHPRKRLSRASWEDGVTLNGSRLGKRQKNQPLKLSSWASILPSPGVVHYSDGTASHSTWSIGWGDF